MSHGNIAQRTFVDFGAERLSALCAGVEAGSSARPLMDVFDRLVRPWGSTPIGAKPRYRSNVSDDQAPFEFSIALSGSAPEVQVYVDVQSVEPTLARNTAAARDVLAAVAPAVGASLAPLQRIESLFFPEDPRGPFALWIGASWTASRGVRLKAYLNPAVRGAGKTLELIGEAMQRLGFEASWRTVAAALSREGERRDEVGILSLDLSDARDARVKLYVRHHGAVLSDIVGMASLATDCRADDVAAFYRVLAGGDGPYLEKPALTELAFVEPGAERPSSVTVEFPVGSYVHTDQVAAARIRRCMGAFGISYEKYDGAIRRFATRPLHEGGGIHSHVTLRWVRELPSAHDSEGSTSSRGAAAVKPRIGVYLASEAYSLASREK